METPDGKDFSARPGKEKASLLASVRRRLGPIAGAVARLIARAIAITARAIWRALVWVARAIGKFSITTWRLASALDSALWRATKLLARRFWDAALHGLKLAGQVTHSFVLWLPTRTGRAYSAVAGVVFILSLLAIVDLLRQDAASLDGNLAFDRAPIDEDDPILARIEGRYVHLSEIEAAARASGQLEDGELLTPVLAFERGLVESYVEQRLLARAARDGGLHRQPGVLRRVNAARDRILAASLIQSRLDDAVTPDVVQRFYQSQRKVMEVGDEVRARHILVETGAEAEEIVGLLEGGASFAALARERSLDRATAPLGGEIGWFSRAMLSRRLSNAAFSTPVGEIAAPVETEFGWHVLEVLGRRPTNARPFPEVQDDIEEYLKLQTIAETLRDLEAESQVAYYRPEIPETSPTIAPLIGRDEMPSAPQLRVGDDPVN
ncbi:MAG: peptidylprolyl isomerase [Pseudomonadota bacterium]